MNLQKVNGKWYLKDMARIVAMAYQHGDGWCISGEDESGHPFTTWAQKEARALYLLKKYTGYRGQ